MKAIFRSMSINQRLGLLIATAIALLVIMETLTLFQSHAELLESRKMELESLVNSAHNIIADQHQRALRGEISEQQARSNAKNLIEVMRYRGEEYFFIFDSQAHIVAHGDDPQSRGKDLSNVTTADGQQIFRKMVTIANLPNASQFVPYLWPKAGSSDPQPKQSYVKSFSPWGWVVGTGIYINDVNEVFYSKVVTIAGQALVIVVLLIMLALPIKNSVIKPLNRVQKVMEIAATGDLTPRVNLKTKDELAEVGHSIDDTLDVFQKLMQHLHQTVHNVQSNASQLAASAEQTKTGNQQQTNETEQLSAAMLEMIASVQEISRNASDSASATDTADTHSRSVMRMSRQPSSDYSHWHQT